MKQKCTFLFFLLAASAVWSTSLRAQLINTFAGNGAAGYSGNGGLATLAKLNSCTGVGFDGAGNIYIADKSNNVVRKVSPYGIISTFAGNDTAGYSGDGGKATAARLNQPYGVTADIAGNVYIADYGNNAVRMVTPSGTISTLTGNGSVGYTGDGGLATAAQLSGPEALAIDQAGNLYIADANNNAVRIIYASDNYMSTFAGGAAGYSGDGGPAIDATLHSPEGLAIDIYGNVYIADYLNNAIRKVDTTGTITTFAGTGYPGYSGDGGAAGAAGLRYPSGVAVYGFGNVYIADEGNNVVRLVNDSGIISTFAGTGTNGYRGDGGNAPLAELSSPKALAVDALSRVFIADYNNNVVRVVYANTPVAVNNITNTAGVLKLYPNPSNGAFTITLPVTGAAATITMMDVLGRSVGTKNIDAASQTSDLYFDVPAGSYLINVSEAGNNYKATLTVIK